MDKAVKFLKASKDFAELWERICKQNSTSSTEIWDEFFNKEKDMKFKGTVKAGGFSADFSANSPEEFGELSVKAARKVSFIDYVVTAGIYSNFPGGSEPIEKDKPNEPNPYLQDGEPWFLAGRYPFSGFPIASKESPVVINQTNIHEYVTSEIPQEMIEFFKEKFIGLDDIIVHDICVYFVAVQRNRKDGSCGEYPYEYFHFLEFKRPGGMSSRGYVDYLCYITRPVFFNNNDRLMHMLGKHLKELRKGFSPKDLEKLIFPLDGMVEGKDFVIVYFTGDKERELRLLLDLQNYDNSKPSCSFKDGN